MPGTIEENATSILSLLAELPRSQGEYAAITGRELAERTNLSPDEINDAITILVESGLADWLQTLGTGPFDFNEVWITPRGRYEVERIASEPVRSEELSWEITRPPSPVGSPFGFTDIDWEIVAERKFNKNVLYVVLGFQFKSEHYNLQELTTNIERMFEDAVNKYNQMPGSNPVDLDFHPLAAGYGGHLFNEIARDIISSDVSVFETSNLNPNVMIEMGVALTWGVRVLPIKEYGERLPPSDISGQTWAEYTDSGAEFIDPAHARKLVLMVQRAVRKKGHG
jgi:hypothetical protein